ncbi:MAG: hypothetical protein AB7J28_04965 [Hyphomonadaceae bacterium]
MRLLVLLVAVAAVCGLAGCNREPRVADLSCAPVTGAEALLERPAGGLIVIDGADAPRAGAAIGCAAAQRGERVVIVAGDADATALVRPAQALTALGARVDVFRFDSATMPEGFERRRAEERERAYGEARNDALARSIANARRNGAPDRMILIVSAPDAARAPVGLSGYTWRPLGARLPPQQTVALRAEASLRTGVRVSLLPFEDVPEEGAALQYDGLVEVGPATQQQANTTQSAR